MVVATTMALSIANAHAEESARYVPVRDIPCTYQLTETMLRELPPKPLTAVVRVFLDASGSVQDAVVSIPSGNGTFDKAVVRASRLAVCKPFSDEHGIPVPVETNFRFAVRGDELALAAEFRPDPASETFAAKVERRVRPHVMWDGQTPGLRTIVSVHCAPDGKLLSATIIRSSGNQAWDAVALHAVQASDPMPSDSSGQTPVRFSITLRSGPA